MEHVVCSQIGRHLDDYNILYPHQHGFHKQLSCNTQLISSIDDWASSINMKWQTDVIMLDFSKAFDKVSHTKLLHKIRHYGITSNTNNWIKAFLGNRSQQVVVNGQASNPAAVLSGVPQGTVLGHMLFLLYINDIPEGVHSKMRLFADDSIVNREILTPQDHISLNNDIDALHQCHGPLCGRWISMWRSVPFFPSLPRKNRPYMTMLWTVRKKPQNWQPWLSWGDYQLPSCHGNHTSTRSRIRQVAPWDSSSQEDASCYITTHKENSIRSPRQTNHWVCHMRLVPVHECWHPEGRAGPTRRSSFCHRRLPPSL